MLYNKTVGNIANLSLQSDEFGDGVTIVVVIVVVVIVGFSDNV